MKILAVTLLLAPGLHAQNAGADLFNGKCSHCHGVDGMGNTPAGKAHHVPAFTAPEILKMSGADLIAIVKNGKGKMPSYGNRLSDAQIQEAVGYVRTLQKQAKKD